MDSVFTLALAVVILSLIVAVQSVTVPWLWWRALKTEAKVEALDEVLADLLEAAGLKPGPVPPVASPSPALPPVVRK
jgi:hypothetical protein